MCFFVSFAALWCGYTHPAHATCINPVGDHGDMLYNRDHTVMQYCNGTNWISMDASRSGGADNLGNHTATKDLDMADFKVINAAIPTSSADLTNKAYVDAAVASAAGAGGGNYQFNCNPSSAAGKGNPAFCVRMDIATGTSECVYNDGTATAFTWKSCAAPFSSDCMLPLGGTIANGSSKTLYTAEMHANCSSIAQVRNCTNGVLGGTASYQYEACTNGSSCSLDGVTKLHGESHTFYSTAETLNCTPAAQTRTCNNGTFSGTATYNKAACTDCMAVSLGAVCAVANGIYIGTYSGTRIYAALADEPTTLGWKTSSTATSGASNNENGKINTDAMVAAGAADHPAAKACNDKAPAGTWYLPAYAELNLIWTNKDAINLSARGFVANDYWASSQYTDATLALSLSLNNGALNASSKTGAKRVRCVRR